MKELLKRPISRKSADDACSVFLFGLELPIKNVAARRNI